MFTIRAAFCAAVCAASAFPAAAASVTIPFWTPVPVRILQNVSSRNAIQGQMAQAEIAEDVIVDGRVVLKKGMPVWTDISYVKKRASFGVPGRIAVKTLFAPISGSDALRLRGSIDAKGAEGGAGLAVATVAFGLTGAIVTTGRSGDIPAGTTFLAHIDEERSIELPAATQASATQASTAHAGM